MYAVDAPCAVLLWHGAEACLAPYAQSDRAPLLPATPTLPLLSCVAICCRFELVGSVTLHGSGSPASQPDVQQLDQQQHEQQPLPATPARRDCEGAAAVPLRLLASLAIVDTRGQHWRWAGGEGGAERLAGQLGGGAGVGAAAPQAARGGGLAAPSAAGADTVWRSSQLHLPVEQHQQREHGGSPVAGRAAEAALHPGHGAPGPGRQKEQQQQQQLVRQRERQQHHQRQEQEDAVEMLIDTGDGGRQTEGSLLPSPRAQPQPAHGQQPGAGQGVGVGLGDVPFRQGPPDYSHAWDTGALLALQLLGSEHGERGGGARPGTAGAEEGHGAMGLSAQRMDVGGDLGLEQGKLQHRGGVQQGFRSRSGGGTWAATLEASLGLLGRGAAGEQQQGGWASAAQQGWGREVQGAGGPVGGGAGEQHRQQQWPRGEEQDGGVEADDEGEGEGAAGRGREAAAARREARLRLGTFGWPVVVCPSGV